MRIHFAGKEDRAALEPLWKACFEAEENYLDLYFSKRFRPEETLVCEEEGQICSMLTLLPCLYRQEAHDYSCAYVFAVGTLPAAAGQGLSTALLQAADQILTRRGTAVAILAPASDSLFAFYSQRGYLDWFTSRKLCFPPLDPGLASASLAGEDSAFLRRICPEEYRNRRLQAMPSAFVDWDERALCFAEEESRLFGGGLYEICRKTSASGLLSQGICNLYRPSPSVAIFKELLLETGASLSEKEGIQILRRLYPACQTSFRLQAVPGETAPPSAMAKWYGQAPTHLGGYLSFILD